MNPRIIIIGAGGHARVVTNLARLSGRWEIAGVLDCVAPAMPEYIDSAPVVGSYDDAAEHYAAGVRHAALAIGDNRERSIIHARLSALGFAFPVLRHPSSLIEKNAVLGEGSVICAGVIICSEVQIGLGVIVNTGSLLDHETLVGNFAHVAPGCKVAGRVRIGAGTLIGIGSCVRDKISIGDNTTVGAGSVVVDAIPAGVVAYGSPARVIRHKP